VALYKHLSTSGTAATITLSALFARAFGALCAIFIIGGSYWAGLGAACPRYGPCGPRLSLARARPLLRSLKHYIIAVLRGHSDILTSTGIGNGIVRRCSVAYSYIRVDTCVQFFSLVPLANFFLAPSKYNDWPLMSHSTGCLSGLPMRLPPRMNQSNNDHVVQRHSREFLFWEQP